MKYTSQEICNALNLDFNDILNIYPYGSQVYGNANIDSDSDYIIVYKRSILPSGSFKDNAISSKDKMIQCTCYSKGGFIDAINNYQISALECIFLPEELIVKNAMKFKISKFVEKDFIKKVITTASNSAYNAQLANKDKHILSSMKNIYHALRIIQFGQFIKDGEKIDYSASNKTKETIYNKGEELYNFSEWWNLFIKLSNNLRNGQKI